MKLAVLGDLHISHSAGNVASLRDALQSYYDLFIQIGDFSEDSFDYHNLASLDPEKVKILGGNHEHWPTLLTLPFCLPPFGVLDLNGCKVFWLRGAYSIDSAFRKKGSWWPEWEQLHFAELYEAYLFYMETKPDILIAHEASTEAKKVLNLRGLRLEVSFNIASPTQQTLDKMLEAHRPKLVVNGHWHVASSEKKDGTYFRSLGIGELRTFDTEELMAGRKP